MNRNAVGERPHVIILGGCNGVGKTTAARTVLAETLKVMTFVNADVIAQGLSGFDPDSAALEASRIMLERVRQLAKDRTNFAFETTLAARSYAPWLREIRKSGYYVTLLFFWLKSPDLAVDRVRLRVASGGHSIPENTIRRRYARSLANFQNIYRSLVDEWRVYDNSRPHRSKLIATGAGEEPLTIFAPRIWKAFTEACHNG